MDQPIVETAKVSRKRKRLSPLTQRRATLMAKANERVEDWIKQVKQHNALVRVTKANLQNWILCQRSSELTNHELDAFCREFSDSVRIARALLKDVMRCEEANESSALFEHYLKLNGRNDSTKNRQRNSKKDDAPGCLDSAKNDLKTAANDKKNRSQNIENLIEKNQE
ncbi:MAG: hypothetical protein KA715_00190 [Xanthomonadaceae bacterium]|nr:hypothetical protein [Xanthomonadaceae bacterium]